MPREKATPRFVISVRNDGYLASLEQCKVYRVIEDSEAETHRMMRVIDESGEACLYPQDRLVAIELPRAAAVVVSRKPRSVSRSKA